MRSSSVTADALRRRLLPRHPARHHWRRITAATVVGVTLVASLVDQLPFTGGQADFPVTCPITADAEPCWRARTGVPGMLESDIVAGRTTLRRVRGDVTITDEGAVLHDLWVDGCVAVRASGVVLYRMLVRSDHGCPGGRDASTPALVSTGDNGGGGVQGLVVFDTEIDGMGAPGDTMGIGQTEYTCLRCNIHGTAKGAKADQDVVLRDSYIHHLAFDGATHTEGFFFDGGTGHIVVQHNWIKANEELSTAALSLNNDWPGHDVTIDGNYLEGVAGADLTGGAMGKGAPNLHHVVITNNALSPNNGYGGTTYAYGFDPNAPGNVWQSNLDAVSGAPVPAPTERPRSNL